VAEIELYCVRGDANATGVRTAEGFVVKKEARYLLKLKRVVLNTPSRNAENIMNRLIRIMFF
jgi:hypothetical protein